MAGLKQLLTAAVALALVLPGCAAEEPKQTEQPAAAQEAVQADPTAAPEQPAEKTAKSDSIDDAPAIDPEKHMEPEPTKVPPAPAVRKAEETEAAAETSSQAEVHLVSMNMKSKKYHEPGCRYYGCRSCDEVSLDEAIAAGGVPCKKCH